MDDSLVILFTSGTTGFPKGAVLTHSNLINSTYLEAATNNLVDANRIICCPIPLFHIFGLIVGGFSPLVFGSKTVFPSFFPDTLSTIKAIASEKCTSIKAAPIIFIDILNHPERKNYDLSSLEYVSYFCVKFSDRFFILLIYYSFKRCLLGLALFQKICLSNSNKNSNLNILYLA